MFLETEVKPNQEVIVLYVGLQERGANADRLYELEQEAVKALGKIPDSYNETAVKPIQNVDLLWFQNAGLIF